MDRRSEYLCPYCLSTTELTMVGCTCVPLLSLAVLAFSCSHSSGNSGSDNSSLSINCPLKFMVRTPSSPWVSPFLVGYFFSLLFLRVRENEHIRDKVGEGGNLSKLQNQCGAPHWACSQDTEVMTWAEIKSQRLKQLSH